MTTAEQPVAPQDDTRLYGQPPYRADEDLADELIHYLAHLYVPAYAIPQGNGVTIVSLWEGVLARTNGTCIWWRYLKHCPGRRQPVVVLTWARTARAAAARLRPLYLLASTGHPPTGRHREVTNDQKAPW
jgi:hypothetical protein